MVRGRGEFIHPICFGITRKGRHISEEIISSPEPLTSNVKMPENVVEFSFVPIGAGDCRQYREKVGVAALHTQHPLRHVLRPANLDRVVGRSRACDEIYQAWDGIFAGLYRPAHFVGFQRKLCAEFIVLSAARPRVLVQIADDP